MSGLFRTALNQTILQTIRAVSVCRCRCSSCSVRMVLCVFTKASRHSAPRMASRQKASFSGPRGRRSSGRGQITSFWARCCCLAWVVFLDVAIGLAAVPSLLKTLFGVETAFSRSRWVLFQHHLSGDCRLLSRFSLPRPAGQAVLSAPLFLRRILAHGRRFKSRVQAVLCRAWVRLQWFCSC